MVIYSQVDFHNISESLYNDLSSTIKGERVETLLEKAYFKYGEELPSLLKNSFAFALFTPQTQTYFAARDPLSIKALYYTFQGTTAFFSNSIDTLLLDSGRKREANLNAMDALLHIHYVDYETTMYKGVYRLPPGYSMTIENGKKTLKRFWFPEHIKTNYALTEETAANTLKKLFKKAIEKNIDNLEETAFELSGGLDSSSVVSVLAQEKDPKHIDTYSISLEGFNDDETEYVKSVLQDYTVNNQTVVSSKLDYKDRYNMRFMYQVSPNWPAVMPLMQAFPMMEAMQKDGKKVIISGQGGDHLFTGSFRVTAEDLWCRKKIPKLFALLKEEGRPFTLVKQFVIRPILGEKLISLLQKKEKNNAFTHYSKEHHAIEEFTDKIDLDTSVSREALNTITSSGYSMLMDSNLFHCVEAYFDMEYRHPFMDLDLVEFVLTLPPEFLYKEGKRKWIWRQAMKGILPEKVRNRESKSHFMAFIRQQIEAVDLEKLFTQANIVQLGLMKASTIEEYHSRYNRLGHDELFRFWTMINMEYWYRYNFDPDSLDAIDGSSVKTV